MKRTAFLALLLALLCAAALSAQTKEEKKIKADTGYALGMLVGNDIKSVGIDFNVKDFIDGLKAVVENKKTKMTTEEAKTAVQTAFAAAQGKRNAANLEAGKAFLAKNGKRAGVTTTASGLQYEVLQAGGGPKPAADSIVTVHYEGRQLDGTVFDSSYERGEPAELSLDGVIPGWAEGVRLMQTGSKYRFFIPPELAYGEAGAGETIEPNAVIIFDVELVSIGESETPPAAPKQ